MDDEFSGLIPAHRTFVNYLINNNVIEHYAVSMETQRVWITMHGESKKEINKVLTKSPIYKYWTLEIVELFVLVGQHYRLPAVQPN